MKPERLRVGGLEVFVRPEREAWACALCGGPTRRRVYLRPPRGTGQDRPACALVLAICANHPFDAGTLAQARGVVLARLGLLKGGEA